jgi:periplasmic copper chaperone A
VKVRGYHKPNRSGTNMRFLEATGLLLACAIATNVAAAGRLTVEHAWIRTAPPGAMMLAGYATLHNDGDAVLAVVGAHSDAFVDVSLHATHMRDGVVRMEPLHRVELAPGESATLEPEAWHLMLMQPRRALTAGDTVKIHIDTDSGDGTTADFAVRDTAPKIH